MGFPGEFLAFILIWGLISAGLYGVTTFQGRFKLNTYVYFMHYSEDSSAKKSLVIAIWCVMTHSVKSTQAKSGFLIRYMSRSCVMSCTTTW
ncbi:hypothetical protein EDD17DRAFT_1615476 [Pisolithus thermaeus]|nr:hypothetical protein EDD17DRAFT_1615476 [Pisolithus thermaeus]